MQKESVSASSLERVIKIVFFTILYKILLDVIYKYYISDRWLFMGFLNYGSIKDYVVSWLLLLLFIPLIVKNMLLKDTSSLFVTSFNFVSFIPNLVLIGQYKSPSLNYIILLCMYWFFMNTFNLVIPKFSIKTIKPEKDLVYYFIMIVTTSIIIYTSYVYTGFRLDLNIFNAYTYRSEAQDYKMTTLLLYLFSIARNIFPIFLIERLTKKKYFQFVLLLLIGFLAYSVTGSKSALFSYFLVIIGYLLYKKRYITLAPLIMVIISLLSIVEILMSKKSFIIDVVIRRAFFVPGLLSYYYYNFFSINAYDYFRQSILGKLGFSSMYDVAVPQIIGDLYAGGAYANAGLFSDGYSNLGLLGMIIMPFLIVILIRLLESTSEGLNEKIIFIGSMTGVFSLINSNFFTSLITHGILASIVVFDFINKE